MIIVYSSKSGSSKKYAESLSSRIGADCYSADQNYPKDDSILFFGWLKKNLVSGIRSIDHSKLVAVCVVGLDSDGRFNEAAVSKHNDLSVPIFYLRGWIDRSKLDFFDKAILLAVSIMMRIQGLNQFNQPIYDAMMEGGSFYDESYLDEIEAFCSSLDK